nr:zinc finger, CCHC-type [Tanacetum cinerariifolium]
MAAATMKHMALNFSELDKIEWVKFRIWKKKMHFLLSSMIVVYVLTTPILEDGKDATMEQLRKRANWDNDDYVCRGLILKDFKHTLKHNKEELTLVELGSHVRIEESLRVQGVEDRRHVPNWILRLANDRVSWDNYHWGSYVWPTLYKHLRDANVKRWQPLYASDPTNETDTKSYSIEGFAWAFKTWILESFRAATNDYYIRYRRHPRIVAWSSKHKFYRHMLKPMLH